MSFYAFDSTDSGAPTLNGVNGAWINVLDWVIVTKGGGTKVYSGTNKAIYRLAGGGMYLRVVHDSAVSGAASRATIRGCESASGIDTIVDPFPLVSQFSDSNCVAYASLTANSTARPYFGIVSDTFIAVVVRTSSNNQCVTWAFGQFAPASSTDAWNWMLCFPGNSTYGMTWAHSTSLPALYFARSLDGTVKSSLGIIKCVGGVQPGNASVGPTYPVPYDSKLHHAAIPMTCYGSQTSTHGAPAMLVRGWFPHLREPLHKATLVASGDTFTDTSYNASFVGRLFQDETVAGPWAVLEFSDTWSAP